jgi:hypothetical protein
MHLTELYDPPRFQVDGWKKQVSLLHALPALRHVAIVPRHHRPKHSAHMGHQELRHAISDFLEALNALDLPTPISLIWEHQESGKNDGPDLLPESHNFDVQWTRQPQGFHMQNFTLPINI